MRKILLTKTGHINWKFILIFTGSYFFVDFVSSILSNSNFSLVFLLYLKRAIVFVGLPLLIWAFIIDKEWISNKTLDLILKSIFISAIIVPVNIAANAMIFWFSIVGFYEYEYVFVDILTQSLFWIFILLFSEGMNGHFKNKFWLFITAFLLSHLTNLLIENLIRGIELQPFSGFVMIGTALKIITIDFSVGYLAGYFVRLLCVQHYLDSDRELFSSFRQLILTQLGEGKTKIQIFNNLKLIYPKVAPTKLVNCFTEIAEPNDIESRKLLHSGLVIYVFFTFTLSLRYISSYVPSHYDFNRFGDNYGLGDIYVIILPILNMMLILLWGYILYCLAYHRAKSYKLTIIASVVIGLIGILMVGQGGILLFTSSMIHLLAAAGAYIYMDYVFPNYNFIGNSKDSMGDYLL